MRHGDDVEFAEVFPGTVEPLSREMEAELLRRYQDHGDQTALDMLVRANLRFVARVAAKYKGSGVEFSELVNIGSTGLLTAIRRYDSTKGCKLISYAVWWIRQAIQAGIPQAAHLVRQPDNRRALRRELRHAQERAEQEQGQAVDPWELDGDELPLTPEDLAWWEVAPLSLSAPLVTDDSGRSLMDYLAAPDWDPDQEMETQWLRARLERLLDTLPDRTADIVRRYYGLLGEEPVTLETIAQKLGLTRERVRQLKEQALTELRRHANKDAHLVEAAG